MRKIAAAAGPSAARPWSGPWWRRGQLRLGVLASHTFEDDLGPFVRGAVEAPRVTVLTDGLGR